jgi:hypothetical protein
MPDRACATHRSLASQASRSRLSARIAQYVDDDCGDVVRASVIDGQCDEVFSGFVWVAHRFHGLGDGPVRYDRAQPVRAQQEPVTWLEFV